MIDQNTDFFEIEDNFAKTAHVPSKCIIESRLDFEPQFTIAIPTFKRPDLLREALDSALNQTDYSNYEVVVVDNNPERDCDTEKLLKSYDVPNLRYYKNSENLGMTGNWNRLYTIAKGEWVIMLHDDDVLCDNYLKSINALISNVKFNVDVVYPSYVTFNKLTDISSEINKDFKLLYRKIETIDFLWVNFIGAPIGMCVKKSVVLKINGFDQNYFPSIDYHFYVKLSRNFKSIQIFGNPICLYRVEANESINFENLSNWLSKDQEIKSEILKEKYPYVSSNLWNSYTKVSVNKYIDNYIRQFYSNNIEVISKLQTLKCKINYIDLLIFNTIYVIRYTISRIKNKYVLGL